MLSKKLSAFFVGDNAIAQSDKISPAAKGIYFYCVSLPDNWEFSVERVARANNIGLKACRNYVAELESFGLLKRVQSFQNNGDFGASEWELFDSVTIDKALKNDILAMCPRGDNAKRRQRLERPTLEATTPRASNARSDDAKGHDYKINSNTNKEFTKYEVEQNNNLQSTRAAEAAAEIERESEPQNVAASVAVADEVKAVEPKRAAELIAEIKPQIAENRAELKSEVVGYSRAEQMSEAKKPSEVVGNSDKLSDSVEPNAPGADMPYSQMKEGEQIRYNAAQKAEAEALRAIEILKDLNTLNHEALVSFYEYRKEAEAIKDNWRYRKTITQHQVRAWVNMLVRYPKETQAAMVSQAISSGWAGIYELKNQGKSQAAAEVKTDSNGRQYREWIQTYDLRGINDDDLRQAVIDGKMNRNAASNEQWARDRKAAMRGEVIDTEIIQDRQNVLLNALKQVRKGA